MVLVLGTHGALTWIADCVKYKEKMGMELDALAREMLALTVPKHLFKFFRIIQ